MRAVVDANIFVSALLSPNGACAQVLREVAAGRITLVTSEPLLAEIEEVLGRAKFRRRGISAVVAGDLIALLRRVSVIVPIQGNLEQCRDPKDDKVIETAVRGNAAVLVSGDADLTRAQEVIDFLAPWGIRVLTVRQFLELLRQPSP